VLADIEALKVKIEAKGLTDDLLDHVNNIERDFKSIRDRLLTAASAGLSMAVVIHEVEKGIQELSKAVDRENSSDRVVSLAKHLSELVEGLTYLTRSSGQSVETAGTLINHAIYNTEYRLKHHNIAWVNGLKSGNQDFSLKCLRRLIIATLMNLIDNSIYWLNTKGGHSKQIYLGTSILEGKPVLVVADSGPGFQDSPEFLVEPFVTRKPDGMGLGLHIASEVMKVHDGKLAFPAANEVGVPGEFGGAVVALMFPRKE
jgi:nitrogen fixation/metabolism regulation signal transduction histidine kinase